MLTVGLQTPPDPDDRDSDPLNVARGIVIAFIINLVLLALVLVLIFACAPAHSAQPLQQDAGMPSLTQLKAVNLKVNKGCHYVPDPENSNPWGMNWDWLGRCLGDCEDFALHKRDLLRAQGVTDAHLRIGLYQLPGNTMHAVLLATTAHGTYILDNMNNTLHRLAPDRSMVIITMAVADQVIALSKTPKNKNPAN